jgi:hypothetical protein
MKLKGMSNDVRFYVILPVTKKTSIFWDPLKNTSEIQFVPHRNHITSPLRAQQFNAGIT